MLVEPDRETDLHVRPGSPQISIDRASSSDAPELTSDRSPTPDAILLTCRDCARLNQWAEVENIASRAALAFPEESAFHAQWAWAVYRQDRTIDAFQIINKAADLFPHSVSVAYCAACLNGALKRVREARRWLDLAIERASNPDKVKLRSLVQPELQCIWGDGPSRPYFP
jgi:Flp pilus assembly protein TadD